MSAVKDLVIRAVSLAGQPLTHAMTARFDAHGGTLGRSDSNTLALPDPRRHISRLQAEVVLQGAVYVLRNAGNANPIVVNQTSLPPGASAPLAHGDELQIGAYVLRVSLEAPQSQPRTSSPTEASPIPAHTVIMASAAEPKTHPRRRASPPGPQTVGIGEPYSLPHTGATSPTNPFADLLGPAASRVPPGTPGPTLPFDPARDRPAPAPAPRGAPASAPAPNPWAVGPGAPPPRAPLPDDFDPFATTTTIGGARPAPAARDDPFAGLIDRAAPVAPAASPLVPADPIAAMLPPSSQSIDDLFGLSPVASGPRRDVLGDFLADAPAPRADDDRRGGEGRGKQGGANLDPLAMFEPPASAGAASPRIPSTVVGDHTPELNAAWRPPELRSAPDAARGDDRAARRARDADVPPGQRGAVPEARGAARAAAPAPRAAAPAPRAAASASPPTAPAADALALWRAFEQGAGVDALPDEARTPELMAIVGRMLRASVDGTLRLMAARAATKQELRAQVTVIRQDANNPLKFTLDGQAAVEQLLRAPMRGFMPATDAVQDAMDDLLGHTVGTMTGMRAALQGVLARFTPAQLEAGLSDPSMLDKLLPMNRHAKLWELYLAHHARVQGEAEDRFDSLFGAAFVKAYEEQLEALAQARRAKDGNDNNNAPPPDATLPAA